MLTVVAGKRYSSPLCALPYPSPSLATVMSSGGTSSLAFEVAYFSEHIVYFVWCLVCFLVALPVCLLRGLTAVSGATTTTQEHTTWKNKQTNPKSQTKNAFEGRTHIPQRKSLSPFPTSPYQSYHVQLDELRKGPAGSTM